MRIQSVLFILLGFAASLGGSSVTAQTDAGKWTPTWADEFDGKTLDRTKWDYDRGNGFFHKTNKQWIGGWGNDELQFYTDSPKNVFLKDGMLHIKAIKEPIDRYKFTSGRIRTSKIDGGALFNQAYGRFEIRAKMPTGQGVWPALWMLPQDEKYGGWAASGEIDILEARGQKPNEILGTLHYGGSWPDNKHSGKTYKLPNNGTIADFHVYAIEWEPGEIRWLFDGKQYAAQSSWYTRPAKDAKKDIELDERGLKPWPAPFDQPFYLIMNVAVGGKFVGNPDDTTKFPAEMVVDYVRAYKKADGYGPAKKRGKENLPADK